MADIRIDFQGVLSDGQVITFKAPCDCSAIDGLKVYYVNGEEKVYKKFTMKDAHGNTLMGLGNLFSKNAYVTVVLDTVNNYAFLQNAATNGYLENKLGTLSNPNLLINGDFRVNQRGETTYNASNSARYTLDRWKASAALKVTVGENSITLENTGTSAVYFSQPFEKTLNKGEYTLSCNVLSVNGKVWLYDSTSFVLSKGINKKTINNSFASFSFGLNTGASVTLEWAKIEQGVLATPFIPKHYAEELMLCQRYYYRTGLLDPVGFVGSTGMVYLTVPQIMNMRESISVDSNFTTFKMLSYNSNKTCNISSIAKAFNCEIAIGSDNTNITNQPVCVGLAKGNELILDAEIY